MTYIVKIYTTDADDFRPVFVHATLSNLFPIAWILSDSKLVKRFTVKDEDGAPYKSTEFGFADIPKWEV